MCLYPRLVDNPKYKVSKKNGGKVPLPQDERVLKVAIGCGMCMECMKQKANTWKVRLLEDLKVNTNGHFVTLTFSNEEYQKLYNEIAKSNLDTYTIDNAIATLGTRRFLERHRKHHKKSLRHWLITELGGEGTENVHLHGIIWTDYPERIEKHWQYGYSWKGTYVGPATAKYITKYVTKTHKVYKHYKPVILCSAGIGANYKKTHNAKLNKFNWENTKETYTTREGRQIAMPTYWRNQTWTEDQREQLWLQKLDQQVRYVDGKKIDISQGEDEYYRALEHARKLNKELGYGSPDNWDAIQYEKQRRFLKQQMRLKNTTNRVDTKSIKNT